MTMSLTRTFSTVTTNYARSSRAQKKTTSSSETPDERAARKKQENIVKLEKHLKTLEKNIQKWDAREVDLDDERNSSYLVRTRMVNVYMKHYKVLCKAAGSNCYTGRPIEKKLKIGDGITHPDIHRAVETFMNGKDILFIPDFHDIENVVVRANNDAHPQLIPESEVTTIAKTLFHEVIRILRCRRRQDFDIAVPLETTEEDPAENDEELNKKLAENDRLRGSEKSVLDKFVKKQEEENENAVEVEEENPDASACESDDESDEEDLEAEVDTENENEEGSRKDQVNTRDQADEDDEDEQQMDVGIIENVEPVADKAIADQDNLDDCPSPSKRKCIE